MLTRAWLASEQTVQVERWRVDRGQGENRIVWGVEKAIGGAYRRPAAPVLPAEADVERYAGGGEGA